MPGGNRTPYRAPCGYTSDEAERYWLGSPWQHYDPAAAAIEKLQNTTLVPDYRDPSCDGYAAGGIPPYMRPNTAEFDCQGGTGGICAPLCGPWPEPVPVNTYAPYGPAEYLNSATCRKIGYKIIFARKAWHGRYGFTYRDHCCFPDGDCCSHPAINTPPANKYLTLTWSISSTQYNNAGVVVQTTVQAISGTCSVGRKSGVVTYSDIVATNTDSQNNGGSLEVCVTDLCTGLQTCTGDLGDSTSTIEVGESPLLDAVNSFCNQSLTATYENSDEETTNPNDPIAALFYPGLGGSLVMTVTETSYSREWTGNVADGSGDYVNYSITATLSDAYSSDDLNDDLDELLAEWDLADDTQIPFRHDDKCTSGPYVTYLENSPMAPIASFCDNTDTTSQVAVALAAYGVDSKILGSSLTAGSDPYFDFRAVVWDIFPSFDCDGCWNVAGWGESAPVWAPNATQWTNLQDASALLPCAFRAYNTLHNALTCCNDGALYMADYLVGSKYAEVILLSQPSHNFARPCGDKDAETIDQTTITTCAGADSPCNLGDLRWMDLTACPVPPADGGNWNDNFVKGDWCLLTWTFDYRDVGENTRLRTVSEDGLNPDEPGTGMDVCEYDPDPDSLPQLRPTTGPWKTIACEQHCSQFVPCCPAVVYISNNGESSTNSQTFEIPNLAADDLYGAQWQQAIQQWMTDPLWQRPVISEEAYNAGGAWLEDDGSGLTDGDGKFYYPQRPWEEARCSLPAGAPALPGGCYIGVMSVDDINAGSTAGNIITAPVAGQCWMPWWTWAINRLNNDGRFSCIYHDPMAICDDDPEIEPP